MDDGVLILLNDDAEAEYLRKGSGDCPVCGSGSLEGGGMEAEGTTVTQRVSCAECGAQWTDVYQLVDVDIRGFPKVSPDSGRQHAITAHGGIV